MRYVGRVNAYIASFHMDGFPVNNMFFSAFQNNQYLFAVMGMNREFGAGFLFDEADPNIVSQDKFGFSFVVQDDVGDVRD